VNGLEALRYLLAHVPFPAEIDNFIHRRIALSLHALGGAMALMTAPLQFLPRFRESNWNRHRLLGWINCGAVLLGCCASVWMVPHAQTGRRPRGFNGCGKHSQRRHAIACESSNHQLAAGLLRSQKLPVPGAERAYRGWIAAEDF